MAERDRREAEKACQRAEELFLAGNIRGAHRQASRAKRLCPSLPGIANALAAYDVHVAAGAGWRAVFGVRPGDAAAERDHAINKQYRRLCLLVHPDKNRCAAAESAFKLLRQACDEALAAAGSRGEGAAHAGFFQRNTGPHAAPDVPRAAEPPPPPQPMHVPREPKLIYCPSCKNEFTAKIGRVEQRVGMKCARCPEWLSPPWQKKPPTTKEPPAAPGRQVFQCPAKCPECGTQYASKVCDGKWFLRCKACSKLAMVHVQGPDQATATIQRRP